MKIFEDKLPRKMNTIFHDFGEKYPNLIHRATVVNAVNTLVSEGFLKQSKDVNIYYPPNLYGDTEITFDMLEIIIALHDRPLVLEGLEKVVYDKVDYFDVALKSLLSLGIVREVPLPSKLGSNQTYPGVELVIK
ncbi:hypothetical protein [Sulfuricurvum sp.]|uniref:hypothetical protein n=1 Tax=Sulfuricurvum sp. TaxID=2025608 RepID=UPI0035640893